MSTTPTRTGLVGRFAHWCAALNPHAIPPEVQRVARRALFDTLGVVVAGAGHPAVAAVRTAFATERGASSINRSASFADT